MCLSTYLSIYLSIYIYLSLRRSIDQSVSPCICLSFDVSMYSLCIYRSNYLSMCLCILLYGYLVACHVLVSVVCVSCSR